MNRGSDIGRYVQVAQQDPFNEAPIHESGKSGKSLRRPSHCKRTFNEAPIHESGKSFIELRCEVQARCLQ